MNIILGIDPGSRWTALVARHATATTDVGLLAWQVLDRNDLDDTAITAWTDHVLGRCAWVATSVARDTDHLTVAVEAAVAPNPHLGITNPAGIIDAAVLVGGVLGLYGHQAVVVPAGRHGYAVPDGITGKTARRILERAYPADLIGPRETTGRGKSTRQHARAAWDIAGVGARLASTA